MRFSLRLKIMGLFLTTFIILIGIFLILSTRQNRVTEEERNNALRQADTIALQGTIERHQRTLEKVAINLLNTDELLTFSIDQGDADAKMILEGLFLSFQEEGIVRFIVYSEDGRRLLEQSHKLPQRSMQLPETLKATFEKAAEDFEFHYYFRGIEGGSESFPAEYCLVTVITDDDDKTVGFAELALDSNKWLNGVAELTGNTATLWHSETKSYTLSTNNKLIDKIDGKDITADEKKSFSLTQIQSSWLLTDIIPLNAPNNEIVSYLLLSRDVTGSIKKGRQSLLATLVLSIGFVALAICFTTLIINRSIINPINKVISFASDLATGHYADSLEIKTRDEIADMGKSLNLMAEQIRLRASEAEAISTGNLTIPIVVKSSNDVLGTSLKHIVNNIGEIIGLVRKDAELLQESSGQVSRNAEEIRESSETIKNRSISISDASEEITQDVEKLASATEQMSASVHEISDNTSRSKLISTEATELSDQAAETIRSLDSSAEKIEKASGAISDFADQTNLLALNATIEAARAGEAGKGFAVVASEVKDLATQSISTAKSISLDIDEIKDFTSLVVKQTTNVSKSIAELDESALVVSAALTEQSTVADDLAHTISGTYEQVKTFGVNISDISDSITQNNEAIISLSASSQEMSELSKRLQQVVGRFTLV